MLKAAAIPGVTTRSIAAVHPIAIRRPRTALAAPLVAKILPPEETMRNRESTNGAAISAVVKAAQIARRATAISVVKVRSETARRATATSAVKVRSAIGHPVIAISAARVLQAIAHLATATLAVSVRLETALRAIPPATRATGSVAAEIVPPTRVVANALTQPEIGLLREEEKALLRQEIERQPGAAAKEPTQRESVLRLPAAKAEDSGVATPAGEAEPRE